MYDPSARPQSVFERIWNRNHGRGSKEEEPRRRNHGEGILEEESWRRSHGGGVMEEESWRTLNSMKTDLGKSKTGPKTLLGACLGGSLRHLETPWGQELQKLRKYNFSGPSFWTTCVTYVDTCVPTICACFLNRSPYMCFVPVASTGLNF